MSRRVLLGKAGSEHGLFISKIGVDVVNDSGTLCNNDLMIFDSREKGYAQVIKKGAINVARGSSHDETFAASGAPSIAIPNAVVIIYAGGKYIELTSVSDLAFRLTVPNTYPTMASYGYSLSGGSTTGASTPTTTTVNFIVLRGYA